MKKILITDQSLLDLLHGLGGPQNVAPCLIAVDDEVFRQIDGARAAGETDEEALKSLLKKW